MNRANGEASELGRKKPREVAAPEGEQRERSAQTPTHEQICQRAYLIHIEHGGEHGHDIDDWLRAERELTPGENRSPS